MQAETSSCRFETSEMLATFLASTPLLAESWKLCNQSNVTAHRSFVADEIEGVAYLAFSGVQSVAGLDPVCGNLVTLVETVAGKELFPAANRRGEEEEGEGVDPEPVMVHAGLLNLFLSIYNTPHFQSQMFEIMKKGKPVVFTGHSTGGAIASLSTLWLLSYLQSIASPLVVLCITFGSPLLGNESLSRAILQERWTGNFCHVVAKHDIVPRLLFAPPAPITDHLHVLLQLCHFNMSSPYLRQLRVQLQEIHKSEELFRFVSSHVNPFTGEEGAARSCFWPFGNFVFCSDEGAICVDDGTAIVKLLRLTFASSSPTSSIVDHLKYEDYVGKVSLQFLNRRGFMEEEAYKSSSYETGVSLALQSSGISSHEPVAGAAKDCLKMAKRMRSTPNLNSAGLAIGLSKITPLRAQIEWYKASCDESDDQMGYYDSFKQRGASKRDFKVNMNRIKLGQFWNDLIQMVETNQLPLDFNKRAKWVNASQFYKLLVEPLDIAEYYRSGLHRRKGHYVKYGRERRYEIFDRWWREREVSEQHDGKRSQFASLTQDSCFWARVEEAREWLDNIRSEGDPRKVSLMWESINEFDQYAGELVERKEVSRDVVAKNSSYTLWVEELRELKFQLQHFPPPQPDFLDGKVIP